MKFILPLCLVLSCAWSSLAQDLPVKGSPQITVFVTGEVRKASCVTLPSDATILVALAGAGGTTDDANLKKVRLFHKSTDGKPNMTLIDVEQVLNGTAVATPLQDHDTILVSRKLITIRY